jgi:hypothetical protein
MTLSLWVFLEAGQMAGLLLNRHVGCGNDGEKWVTFQSCTSARASVGVVVLLAAAVVVCALLLLWMVWPSMESLYGRVIYNALEKAHSFLAMRCA